MGYNSVEDDFRSLGLLKEDKGSRVTDLMMVEGAPETAPVKTSTRQSGGMNMGLLARLPMDSETAAILAEELADVDVDENDIEAMRDARALAAKINGALNETANFGGRAKNLTKGRIQKLLDAQWSTLEEIESVRESIGDLDVPDDDPEHVQMALRLRDKLLAEAKMIRVVGGKVTRVNKRVGGKANMDRRKARMSYKKNKARVKRLRSRRSRTGRAKMMAAKTSRKRTSLGLESIQSVVGDARAFLTESVGSSDARAEIVNRYNNVFDLVERLYCHHPAIAKTLSEASTVLASLNEDTDDKFAAATGPVLKSLRRLIRGITDGEADAIYEQARDNANALLADIVDSINEIGMLEDTDEATLEEMADAIWSNVEMALDAGASEEEVIAALGDFADVFFDLGDESDGDDGEEDYEPGDDDED